MFKKEIFEIPVISDDSENLPKSLKVEIKVTHSDSKLKSFRDFFWAVFQNKLLML